MRHKAWVGIIAIVLFSADRAIKNLVAHHMVPEQSLPVLPPVLWITYITNNGAAFSLFRNGRPFFIAIALIILIGLAWYVRRNQLSRAFGVGAGLLAGGAAGNLWDRVVSGQVVDYIHFRYFAIFNLADMGIVMGIGLIVLDFWRKDRTDGKPTD